MSFIRRFFGIFTLGLSLMILVSLAGCGGNKTNSAEDAGSKPTSTAMSKTGSLKLTLAGYSSGGASAAVGEAIGGAIGRSVPGTVFNYEPGQSGANEIKVSHGETQLGLSSSLLVDAATNGRDPYKERYTNLRALAFLHTSDMQFLIDKKSGLQSVEDFKVKPVRLATNTKNSFMELLVRESLKSYGITYEDIEKRGGKVYFTNINTALEQMRNRQLDTITMGTLTPTTLFIDVATTLDLGLLPMSKEAIEKTNQAIGSRTIKIPKGAYPFLKEDMDSTGIDNILIVSTDMPDDTAYAITKALYDNMDYLYKVSDTLKQLTKENMASVGRGVILHPGAEKFYKEIGLLK